LTVPLGKEELKYLNRQTREWIVESSEFDVWAGEDPTASLHADLTVTQ
jgi:beta-glucosidase